MKKILLTSIAAVACGVSAFGQGQIVFENAGSSSNFVTLNSLSGPKTGSGLVVELLWYNGSFFVLEDIFTSTFTGNGSDGQTFGEFLAGQLTIPQAGTQTFEVEGFYTAGAEAYIGVTVPFTAEVTVSPTPLGHTDTGGSWTATPGQQGDLVLGQIPEPATIALSGLGAGVLWLFRRRPTVSPMKSKQFCRKPPAP
jgi:hypothetical protein